MNKFKWIFSFLIIVLAINIENKQKLKLSKLSEKSLYTYFEKNQITTDFIQNGIEEGLLQTFEKDTSFRITIPRYKNVFSNIFPSKQKDDFSTIQHEFYYLYNFFTEPFRIKEYPDYYYKLPWFFTKYLINYGWFSPECGGVSALGNRYMLEKVPFVLKSEIVQVESIHHIISSFEFLINKEAYLIAIDFQNGFYGPINIKTRQPIKKRDLIRLVENDQLDSLGLYFLPDKEIKNKRNLIPEQFALNLFPDNELVFYKTSIFNKYFAYRLTYPPNYYVWFYKNKINKHDLMKEISRDLVNQYE